MDKHYAKRRGAFAGTHLREPNASEDRELREAASEDRRTEEALRREREVKRAYVAGSPGASDDDWQREKSGLLAADRADRTKRADADARASHASMYRRF